MKLTKGKISKIYLKKKQSMRKYKKRGKSGKKNGIKKTFRKRGHLDLNRRTLKRLPKKKMFGGKEDKKKPEADKKVKAEAVDKPQNSLGSQEAVANQQLLQPQDAVVPEAAVDSQATVVPEAVTEQTSQPQDADNPEVTVTEQTSQTQDAVDSQAADEPQDAVDSKDTVVPEAAVDSQEVVTDQTSQPRAVNESQSVAEELQDKASNDAQPPVDAQPQETSLDPSLQSTDLQSTGLQSPGLQKDEETIGKLIKDMIKAEIADQLEKNTTITPINSNSGKAVANVNEAMALEATKIFKQPQAKPGAEGEAKTETVEEPVEAEPVEEPVVGVEKEGEEEPVVADTETVQAEPETSTVQAEQAVVAPVQAEQAVEEPVQSTVEQKTPSISAKEPQEKKVEEEEKVEEEKSDTTPQI
jgi:hypothetical protein